MDTKRKGRRRVYRNFDKNPTTWETRGFHDGLIVAPVRQRSRPGTKNRLGHRRPAPKERPPCGHVPQPDEPTIADRFETSFFPLSFFRLVSITALSLTRRPVMPLTTNGILTIPMPVNRFPTVAHGKSNFQFRSLPACTLVPCSRRSRVLLLPRTTLHLNATICS